MQCTPAILGRIPIQGYNFLIPMFSEAISEVISELSNLIKNTILLEDVMPGNVTNQ